MAASRRHVQGEQRTPQSRDRHDGRESTSHYTSTAPARSGRPPTTSQTHSHYHRAAPSFAGPEVNRPRKRPAYESDNVEDPRPVKKGKPTEAESRRVYNGNCNRGIDNSAMVPPPKPDVAFAQHPDSADDLFHPPDHPNPAKVSDLLKPLQPFRNEKLVNDLINRARGPTLDVANLLYRRHHDEEDRRAKEDGQHWRVSSHGQRGDVDVVIHTGVLGDQSRPPKGNKNIRPGPRHTNIIEKLSPAVLISNRKGHHSMIYRILTTFTNTELDTREKRQAVQDNYANFHRTGYDDRTKLMRCFRSLDFTSAQKTYAFMTPCYMPTEGLVLIPKSSKRLHLGHLTESRNFEALDEVLEEEFRRNTPNGVRRRVPADSTNPNVSASPRHQTQNTLPSSPKFSPQSKEVVGPRMPVKADTADILEYIKQNGLPAECVKGIELVAMKRGERERSEKSNKDETTGGSEEGEILE